MGSDVAEAVWTALFRPLGVDGVCRARRTLHAGAGGPGSIRLATNRPSGAEVVRFPPVMSRSQLEKSGYLNSFPNLLGCVCALHGTRGGGDPCGGGRTRDRRQLDGVSVALRHGALAGGLLSGLPDRGGARTLAAERLAVRCRGGLLPPRALARRSTGCSPSACASSYASARPEAIQAYREQWMALRAGVGGRLGLPCHAGYRQRPVLRSRRPGDGRGPETAVA